MSDISIHDHINLVSEKNRELMQKITAPLAVHFGITYFCYQKVTHDGQWLITSNNAQWLHHSAEQGFYRVDPSLVNPTFYQKGYSLPETHQDSILQETLIKDARSLFDLCHSLAIIEPTTDGCEYFFFSAPMSNVRIYNIYLQQLNNLKIFVSYFKENTLKLQQQMTDNPVDLKQLKGNLFYQNDNLLITDDLNAINLAFLNDLNRAYHFPKLTEREHDCLNYLLKGLTAKESAKVLGISPRTVEEYLAQLRYKLQCKDKGEVISKFS